MTETRGHLAPFSEPKAKQILLSKRGQKHLAGGFNQL